jgi:DNA-binding LacI/PurR family transcriptional regulator
MPLVFMHRRPDTNTRVPVVRADNLAAAHDAVGHVIDLGHRDLSMIAAPRALPTASERLRGSRGACEKAGLDVREECVREGFRGIEGGYQATRKVLARDSRPAAVFSFNNLLTVGEPCTPCARAACRFALTCC